MLPSILGDCPGIESKKRRNPSLTVCLLLRPDDLAGLSLLSGFFLFRPSPVIIREAGPQFLAIFAALPKESAGTRDNCVNRFPSEVVYATVRQISTLFTKETGEIV